VADAQMEGGVHAPKDRHGHRGNVSVAELTHQGIGVGRDPKVRLAARARDLLINGAAQGQRRMPAKSYSAQQECVNSPPQT